MKKYLLVLISILTLLLTACDSGLKIKEKIIVAFSEEDKAKFQECVDYMTQEVAPFGYVAGAPTITDNLLEIVFTYTDDSDSKYIVKIEPVNGEVSITIKHTDINGDIDEEEFETYNDLSHWVTFVTNSGESLEIQGTRVDVVYIDNNGYLFNKEDGTWDTSKLVAKTSELEGNLNERIEYSLTIPGKEVGRLISDSNGNDITYSFKFDGNYKSNPVEIIGVHTFPTSGTTHKEEQYLASTASGWDVSGATLVAEGTWVENSLERHWYGYTDGVITYEEIVDSEGNVTVIPH